MLLFSENLSRKVSSTTYTFHLLHLKMITAITKMSSAQALKGKALWQIGIVVSTPLTSPPEPRPQLPGECVGMPLSD